MQHRVKRARLSVDPRFAGFIETEALRGTGITASRFWGGLAATLSELGPENRALLQKRANLQAKIDAWHIAQRGKPHDADAYRQFLSQIGYILPEGADFQIETRGIDDEIARLAGPQLVVPVTNARYALNAANARFGSLHDALYGTDALGDLPQAKGFDPARGARVIAFARAHLDAVAPLAKGSWAGVTGVEVRSAELILHTDGAESRLQDPRQFAGYQSGVLSELQVLLRVNGLLIEILIDRTTEIGQTDPAGISDFYVEAALSAIMDCEDSIAAVDAEDKVTAYRNWLGLMRGDLSEEVTKGGKTFIRRLHPDFDYLTPEGQPMQVRSRALMLVRNVGHLMTNPAILDPADAEIPEGILDAFVTTLCALHDRVRSNGPRNSAHGSIYVVKPKMHGPDEVAFACKIFDRVEDVLGLPRHTVKLGIMDEERRTSVNLKECIRAARHRVAFINTGFLDRTGDEIHTAMEAGPVVPKGDMKSSAWIKAYEDRNVDIGLACGLGGQAQIGKGMWAAPDRMAEMLAQKIAHPTSGANCAWVPSPTAATLHALHYHMVDVAARQAEISAGGPRGTMADLLTLPLAQDNWQPERVQSEVENNAQGILGYVVRWVDQGIGCSKVPDIHNVALMEDRATCRISSQALANWLHHGVVSEADVMAALRKMAAVVDGQNAGDPHYVPMAPHFTGLAFQAACDLVFKGRVQPSGYTEPLLHAARLALKLKELADKGTV